MNYNLIARGHVTCNITIGRPGSLHSGNSMTVCEHMPLICVFFLSRGAASAVLVVAIVLRPF